MPDEEKNEDVVLPNQEASDALGVQPLDQPIDQPLSEPEVQSAVESTPLGTISEPLPQPTPLPPIGSGPEVVFGTPVTVQPKKKMRKGILAAIIFLIVMVLLGGAASAYFFVYQNPEKVVTDALVNAITAKTVSVTGTVDVQDDDYSVKVEVAGRNNLEGNVGVAVKLTLKSDDVNFTVDGEGIYSKDGDIYVKVNDVQKLLDSFEEQSDGALSYDNFNAVIKKIDGNWIKIAKDDLGEINEDYEKTQKCIAEISNSYENDASFRKTVENETKKLYKENNFIVIGEALTPRTIGGEYSFGYPVSADRTKADAFFAGLETTTLGKKIIDCDSSIKFSDFADNYNSEGNTDSKFELWVSRFGHNITEVNASYSDDDAKGKIVLNPVFNKNETVAVPADSVDLKEVLSDFETAYTDLYSSYETEDVTTGPTVNYN